jgi:hypothetical protein
MVLQEALNPYNDGGWESLFAEVVEKSGVGDSVKCTRHIEEE